MKHSRPYLSIVIILFLSYSCQNSAILFQENASDWCMEGDAKWTFANNELIGELKSGSGFVMTKQSYKNFVLKLEFNPDSTINSGIFIRCKNQIIDPTDCYEINIWDLHPNQDYRTGSIVMRASPLVKVETIDKWNTYKIKCEKDSIKVWINDILTANFQDKALTEGFIGLQAAGTGKIMFRNVKIKTLNNKGL